LREESRQVYLERREADKLAELEQEVKDEEYLWEGVKLTDYERARIEQKKKTLEIAKQYKEADKLEKVDRYYIPSDTDKDKDKDKHTRHGHHQQQTDKYAEDIKEKGPNYEQRKWEEDQVNSALMTFGAGDAKYRREKSEKSYEYLLEDEITFVKSLQIPGKNQSVKSGYIKEEKEDREDAFARAKKSLDETRKSLPIYAYRQGLLDAIRDNQIIVIEGETGNSIHPLLI
jgi:pre-mRNA-splicing factor ATP-dependent RNA helicase DHX16